MAATAVGGGGGSNVCMHPCAPTPEAKVCVSMGVRVGRAGLLVVVVVVVAMHGCAFMHPLQRLRCVPAWR